METRVLPLINAEVRAAGEGVPSLIRGYAAVYNSLSVVLYGWFREMLLPGCFSETLANDDIRCLWNHNPDVVLGRNGNNTLRLVDDEKGLFMEVEPPDTTGGRDALISVGRGDVTQQSFMFDVLDDDWSLDENDQLIRKLAKVKLYEVSPVTFPAYLQTSAEARGKHNEGAPQNLPRWVAQRLEGQQENYRLALRKRRMQLIGG